MIMLFLYAQKRSSILTRLMRANIQQKINGNLHLTNNQVILLVTQLSPWGPTALVDISSQPLFPILL